MIMAESAGFVLRYLGAPGRLDGSCPWAALIAACTSRAAASIFRRSRTARDSVAPSELTEVISFSPAMRPNCRSSGVATAEAMVSGLAPGSEAVTVMVENSTCGSGATGKSW